MKTPSNVAWRKVGDDVVVLDLNSSVYYSLGEVAARIWELLQDGDAEETVARKITDEYQVSEQQARQDVQKFVAQLKKEKLIAVGGSRAGKKTEKA